MFEKLTAVKAIQIYQLFRFGAVFITGIILAKSGFSKEDIGAYETFLLISFAVSFFWISGITNTFLAQFPQNVSSQPVLIFNTVLSLFSMSLIAAIFILLLWFFSAIQSPYIFLISLYVLLALPSYLNEYILLVHEENQWLIGYAVFSFVLHVGLILSAIFFSGTIEMALWAMIFLAVIKLIVLFFLLRKYAAIHTDTVQLKLLLTGALPLAISYLLSGSAEVIDSVLVKYFYDEASFAVFRYGAREFPIVLLMANAFSSAAIPKVAADKALGLQLIKDNSVQLYHLFFPVTLVLMYFSKTIYGFVFSPEFVQSAYIFNIYLLLIISRLLFPQTIMNGLGRNRFLMVSAGVEVVLNVICSYVLMQQFGLIGIAMGSVIAHLADKLLLIAYCYFRLGIAPSEYAQVFQHTFYSLVLLVVAYLISFV